MIDLYLHICFFPLASFPLSNYVVFMMQLSVAETENPLST